jgi:hypothetical protein
VGNKHILWTVNVLVAIAIHYASSKEMAFGLFVEAVVINIIEGYASLGERGR